MYIKGSKKEIIREYLISHIRKINFLKVILNISIQTNEQISRIYWSISQSRSSEFKPLN